MFARQPKAANFLPGSDDFVTSVAAGMATRPERPLPGRDLHPLENYAFFTAHLGFYKLLKVQR